MVDGTPCGMLAGIILKSDKYFLWPNNVTSELRKCIVDQRHEGSDEKMSLLYRALDTNLVIDSYVLSLLTG